MQEQAEYGMSCAARRMCGAQSRVAQMAGAKAPAAGTRGMWKPEK